MHVDQKGTVGPFEWRKRDSEKEIILANFKILRTILSHDLLPTVISSMYKFQSIPNVS